MLRAIIPACLLAIAPIFLFAQSSERPDQTIRVGPGVTPPRLLHKTEPEYSAEAREAHIQGTLVLQLVVNEHGRPADISVLSPIGFGLDEKALAAVQTWEFVPGNKDGHPVSILATVEVNFRFLDTWFDEKAERRRTTFNLAAQALGRPNASRDAIDRAVKSIGDLSRQHLAAAMYLEGMWETKGDYLPKNSENGLALIQAAAAKNYGPALYEIALRRIDGRDLPQDIEGGLTQMREAAVLGSVQAQFYLGHRYEKGIGVPQELDRARRYFRLCAAQGNAGCQYRLGLLLRNAPNRLERDYVQSVAWFELAAEQGHPESKRMAEEERMRLTPEQTKWVGTLKSELVRK